ncbi:hypothetical protein [Legionella pneumophila]
MKIKVASYTTKEGIDPFAKWFDKLNAFAAAKDIKIAKNIGKSIS